MKLVGQFHNGLVLHLANRSLKLAGLRNSRFFVKCVACLAGWLKSFRESINWSNVVTSYLLVNLFF